MEEKMRKITVRVREVSREAREGRKEGKEAGELLVSVRRLHDT